MRWFNQIGARDSLVIYYLNTFNAHARTWYLALTECNFQTDFNLQLFNVTFGVRLEVSILKITNEVSESLNLDYIQLFTSVKCNIFTSLTFTLPVRENHQC